MLNNNFNIKECSYKYENNISENFILKNSKSKYNNSFFIKEIRNAETKSNRIIHFI